MFDGTVELGGLKCCSRTEGYSKDVSRNRAEPCATITLRLIKVKPFTDLQI